MGTTGFDEIRPYLDGEVSGVIANLLDDRGFLDVISKFNLPRLTAYAAWLTRPLVRSALRRQLGAVSTIDEFQEVVSRYAKRLVEKSITRFSHSGFESLADRPAHLFVSNHRDIAGDSMLVNYVLFFNGRTTVRIAIGDNLIQRPFATDLMRLNKSFIIRRSESGSKRVYEALLTASRYIEQSLREGESVWIAQSEGRAKDGFDRTDPAVIKMLALAKRKDPRSFADVLEDMSIVPVALSYEYDPCDLLKARELFHIDRDGGYTKPEGEDLLSLVRGLSEFKGEVHLAFMGRLTGCETPEEVAAEIDRQVMSGFRFYPSNYVALSMLDEEPYLELRTRLADSCQVSDDKRHEFMARYNECPMAHRPYFLKMYANPLLNYDQVLSAETR